MPVRDDIGGRLREAREQRGLSLPDAARRTKLSIHVLQAIERNDFDSLPGGMFRKAYVRTLAEEVGLNPNELAADYRARFEPSAEPPSAPRQPFTLPVASIEPPSPAPLRTRRSRRSRTKTRTAGSTASTRRGVKPAATNRRKSPSVPTSGLREVGSATSYPCRLPATACRYDEQ